MSTGRPGPETTGLASYLPGGNSGHTIKNNITSLQGNHELKFGTYGGQFRKGEEVRTPDAGAFTFSDSRSKGTGVANQVSVTGNLAASGGGAVQPTFNAGSIGSALPASGFSGTSVATSNAGTGYRKPTTRWPAGPVQDFQLPVLRSRPPTRQTSATSSSRHPSLATTRA